MGEQHTEPCNECPWRRASAPGWLGDQFTPEEWVQLAHSETMVPCHLNMDAQCVGCAIYRANACKMPRDPEILTAKPDRKTVFAYTGPDSEFVKHHRSTGVVSSELMRRRT